VEDRRQITGYQENRISGCRKSGEQEIRISEDKGMIADKH